MKTTKTLLLVAAIFSLSTVMFAKEKETSVENEYLNDVDGEIISTLADSDELDNKLLALQYLADAIDSGNTSDQVLAALDKLAGEGITNQARTNGRLVNNFPEIRKEACKLMAKVPTEHSKNILINVAIADNEPMVIAAAVQSLGIIGINDNDETIEAIAYANKRNQVLNPTSSLAMEVINAYELLAPTSENKKTMISSLASIGSDYHYVTPVRNKAKKLLKQISSSGDSSSSSK